MPDQYASRHDCRQHQPVMRMVVRHRIMVADHDEQYRQREVIVVHAALFRALAMDRFRLPAGLHRLDQLALPRNDHHQHIADHDGADHRADMDIRGTA